MIIPTLLLLGNSHGLVGPNALNLSYPIIQIVECKEVFSAPALQWGNGTLSSGSHKLALRLKTTGYTTPTSSPNYVAETYISVKSTTSGSQGGLESTAYYYYDIPNTQGYVYKLFDGDEYIYVALPSGWTSNEAAKSIEFGLIHVIRVEMTEAFYGLAGLAQNEVQFKRFNCLESSIDSRKSYGQPNTAGISPTDPNAPLRHINFGDWTYKGGLFVGNMPTSGKDRSGVARIQFYPQTDVGSSSGFLASCLSVHAVNDYDPSSTPTLLSVRAYVPSSEHSELSSLTVAQKELAVTWDKRWLISGFDTIGTINTSGPYGTQTVGTVNTPYCWPLSKDNSGTWAMPLPTYGAVLSMDESSLSSPYWWYFASREWLTQKDGISQGLADGRSRIITLRLISSSGSWTGFPPNLGQ